MEDEDELDCAIIAAKQRGQIWREQFHKSTIEEQQEIVATYIFQHVQGKEMGSQSWQGLQEFPSQDDNLCKQNYRDAARFLISCYRKP